MDKSEVIISRFKFFWFLGISLTIIGILSWFTIPKEEDPRLKSRFGYIKLIYPGASVNHLKKYVVEETEKELASIDGIQKISTTIRSGFAGIRIELKAGMKDESEISRYWDEVENALKKAYKVFPSGAFEPELDRKLEQEAMIISINSNEKIRHEILLDLENELLKNPKVSKVKRLGDEGSQISIEINESKLINSGITIMQLLGQIQAANSQVVSGFIEDFGNRINIQSSNSFDDILELKKFPIITTSGISIELGKIANIQLEEKKPSSEEMRWNGRKVYGLGVVSKKEIDLRTLGESVLKSFPIVKSHFNKDEQIEIEIINSQPEYVKERLEDLSYSLISSVVFLSLFMFLFMGLRVGFLVSIMFPIISLISFGIYNLIGGILHQIAIAAFVLSFGILIDNIVVIVESIQEKIDAGIDGNIAGQQTVSEFTAPLFSSTLTTIAAFLPMALAKDTSSEFTSAIPKIVIISLIVSYITSIVLSPSISAKTLKLKIKKKNIMDFLSEKISILVTKNNTFIFYFLLLFFISILGMLPLLKFKFFPSADRNQLILEFAFQEGTSYKKTLDSVIEFEKFLEKKQLKGYASFIGRSTSFFYYNLPQKPNAPALAQILLISKEKSFPENIKKDILLEAKKIGARVRIKTLEQGPPTDATIAVRIYHKDREVWKNKIQDLIEKLSKTKGVELVWSDSIGEQKKIFFEIQDKKLVELGANRRDVSLALLKTTFGLTSGLFKTGKESIPIVLTSKEKEKVNLNSLNSSLVFQSLDKEVLTKDISVLKEYYSEAVHHLYNRKSFVGLFVDIEKDYNSGQIIKFIKEYLILNGLNIDDFEFDGEVGQSEESNNALLQSLPIGIIILLATLIWEFNSFKLVLLILTTVPTAFLGMIPGLVISGQPFGFLPLLALFALIGIAVNNGIILIDKFQAGLSEGYSIEESVRLGVKQRLRPILLTSGSTILGMIPLGFSSSTLWPPFAWAMVSGLLISSLATLYIIPRLYIWVFTKKKKINKINVLIFLLIVPSILSAETNSKNKISFEQAILSSKNSHSSKAAFFESKKISQLSDELKSATYFPKIGVSGERVVRDRDVFINTPIGRSQFGNREFNQMGLEVYQTIWSEKNREYLIPATELYSKAANKKYVWEDKTIAFHTGMTYIDCAILRIKNDFIIQRINTLNLLFIESKRLASNGKLREIEILKIEKIIFELERANIELINNSKTCLTELSRLVNIEEVDVDEKLIPSITNFVSNDSVREDLEALKSKIEGTKKEIASIKADILPEIYAKGNIIYSDQANIIPFNYTQVAVGVKWNAFDGGIRNSKKNQKESELKNLEELYLDAEKKIKVSIVDWKNKEFIHKTNLVSLNKELNSIELKMKQEQNRFYSGRNSSIYFFQIKDIYLEISEKKIINNWELLRTNLGYNFSSGNLNIKN